MIHFHYLQLVHNPFSQDITVFEIATFIANHPEILSIANMIYKSKRTNWNEPLSLEASSVLLTNQSKNKRLTKKSSLEVLASRYY